MSRLRLVEVASGQTLAETEFQEIGQHLEFSADGALLAASLSEQLLIWDAASLQARGQIQAGAGVRWISLSISPNIRTAVTGGADGRLRLWDLKRPEFGELVAVDLGQGPITKVVFADDGKRIRYITTKRAAELDLTTFEPHLEGNLTWNLLRLVPELYRLGGRAEVEWVLERLRPTHPEAYRRGLAALAEVDRPAKPSPP
jgi:hypothetical protein